MEKTGDGLSTRVLGLITIISVIAAFASQCKANDEIRDANDEVRNTQDCMVEAFNDRDTAGTNRRNAEINWLTEFIEYLETIESQTSAVPLINSAEEFRGDVISTGITVKANDLVDCLE